MSIINRINALAKAESTRAMGDIKYVTPGGWFQVEKVRYGYQLVHRGTGKILPHLGYCRAPEGVSMDRTLIRYLADAKAFAHEVEDFDHGALCTDDTPRDKLQALKAHLEASCGHAANESEAGK